MKDTIIPYMAFFGRGKCPQCGRSYQKDIRLVWWEKNNEIMRGSLQKMCSWCFVIYMADATKIASNFLDKLVVLGNKEKFKNAYGSKS